MNWAQMCLIAGIGFVLFVLVACSGKFAGMNDDDLRDKMNACTRIIQKSPGFAISCDNFTRECQTRRDQGRYVC